MKSSNLTEGNIPKLIWSFAWPVFLSFIFSELYNITNSLIVGNYVSLKALSAVSATTWICNVVNYTFYGLGLAAGIIVGKYYGANDHENLKKALDTSILFAIFGGIVLTIIFQLFLPSLMHICNISDDIFDYAYSYLRVYFLGSTAVLTYQMCFYILRSFGDTKHQLYYSIITSISNIILGVLFVRVFNLSIAGTALATIISQFIMDILALRRMLIYWGDDFNIKNMKFDLMIVKDICRLGIPAGFQNMLIALSSMLVQSHVNTFPNEVIAGIGVGEKLVNWGQMFSVAVAAAVTSLVAQNIGAKKYDRVKESIKECLRISSVLTLISVILVFLFAPLLVSRFNEDLDTINYGVSMIRYAIFGMMFVNLSHIFNGACRGAGNVKAPMVIAIIGQVIVKYLFVRIGLAIFNDVHVLYFATATGYVVAGLLATLYFYTSKWTLKHGLR